MRSANPINDRSDPAGPSSGNAERRTMALRERHRQLRKAGKARNAQHPDRAVAVVLQAGLAFAAQRRDVGHGRHQQHAVAAEQLGQVAAESDAEGAARDDLRIGHAARPGKALGHARAQRRRVALDQRAIGEPGLVRLHVAEVPVHRVEGVERDLDARRIAEHALHARGRIRQRVGRGRHGQRPHVLGPQQPHARGQRGRVSAQQHVGHARKGADVACEPAAGVEAGRKVERAFEAHAAMRGTQAVQAAVVGRRAHRAAGVGAEREVAQAR